MSKKKTFYETLGVAADATLNDIKQAYRRRARVAHPDLHRDRNTQVRKLADEQIRILNEAYNVLTRDHKRKLYDRCLAEGLDFDEVEQYERPETDAEREVRLAAQALEEQGLKAVAADLAGAVQRLVPAARWRAVDPGDPYFDNLLMGQSGPQKFKVWIKVLPELTPEDIPGISQYAEAVMATVPPGLIRESHSYVMVGRTLSQPTKLYETVEAFNHRCFRNVGGRAPRSLVAFGEVRDGVIKVPGIAVPEPPLSSIKLDLTRHFQL